MYMEIVHTFLRVLFIALAVGRRAAGQHPQRSLRKSVYKTYRTTYSVTQCYAPCGDTTVTESSLANALAPLEREEIKRVSAFPLPCHVSHLLHSSMSHVNAPQEHISLLVFVTSLLCTPSYRLTFLVPRRAWLSHGFAMSTTKSRLPDTARQGE